MASTFPMRTGNVSYHIELSAPDITGSWSVSLGFFGLNENSWSISGVSGKLYDNSGYAISSYNSKTDTAIEGVISGSGHSIYQDGVLLTNVGEQEVNDYNMVSISGDYLGGYLPSVNIGGESRLNDQNVQTVPFWNKKNDDNLLFVTENAEADFSFIQCVSGMGFNVTTGVFTGTFDNFLVENNYGLIIFGAATNSGSYASGDWNSFNTPMMSLNSHLVCPQNLGWYTAPAYGGGDDIGTIQSSGYQTGVVFPQEYRSPENTRSIWAEFPTQGWFKLFLDPTSSASEPTYIPYGVGGEHGGDPGDHYVMFSYSAPDTYVYMYDGDHFSTTIFPSDVRPFAGSAEGLDSDLEITFTDVYDAPDNVIVKLSNTLGGTGPSTSTWETPWGQSQIFDHGRVVPQRDTYNVDTLYRRTTLTSGLYPTDQFNMYTGDISVAHGLGGNTLISNMDTGKILTAFPKGFWTGDLFYGEFTKNNLVVFSVTPTGTAWTGGYDMWNTLTVTGKQLFVNSVMEFFIH